MADFLESIAMSHKKTFWMNVVGAVGWLVLTIAMYLHQGVEHELAGALIATFIYSCVIAVPLVTALRLGNSSNKVINWLALFGNCSAIIGCFIYSAILIYVQPNILLTWDALAFPITFLMFALPAAINLKALRAARAL